MFRRRRRYKVPMLNTSSLPDLIFTVLFFFMMVTSMRNAPLRVSYKMPQGQQLTRIDKQSPIIYIYVGTPSTDRQSHNADRKGRIDEAETVIQIDSKFLTMPEITDYVAAKRASLLPQDRQHMVASIRADRGVRMSLINDLRQALRQANVSRILMSAEGSGDKLMQNYQ